MTGDPVEDGWDPSPAYAVELVGDPDPSVWLVGPTEAYPFEAWLPEATEALARDFGFKRRDKKSRQTLSRMLEVLHRYAAPGLPHLFIHWTELRATPMALWVGLVGRDTPESLDGFLSGAEEDNLDGAVLETLEDDAERVLRRGRFHRHDETGAINHFVRYALDQRVADAVVLARSATGDLAAAERFVLDCDELLRSMRIVSTPQGR